MSDVELYMYSFRDEMRKEALNIGNLASGASKFVRSAPVRSAVGRGVGGAGAGAGMGAAVGGTGGAVVGGARDFMDARNRGQSVGSSMRSAAGGAIRGASAGAIGGAAVGGVGLGAARAMGKGSLGTDSALGAASRFGQRQVHSLTGWTPKGSGNVAGIRGMRGGAYEAAKKLKTTKAALATAPNKARAVKAHEAAKKHMASAAKAEEMGLTSLPGYAKALRKDPKAALKAGFGEQWDSMGPGGRALMFGVPAAMAGKEAITDTKEGGPGKGERVGKALGTLAYGVGPMALAGSTALGMGTDAAVGGVGKLYRKATGAGSIAQ